jgi:hypothetical protein
MSGTAEIAISLATYKAIESARLSLAESHDEIIRRIFVRGATRPGRSFAATARMIQPATRRRGNISVSLYGQERPVANLKQAYVTILQSLVKHKPALFELMAHEGTNRRRWIARDATALFPHSPHLVRDHALEVAPGWVIDTNVSRAQIDARLAVACRIAGYRYGDDVAITGG